MKDLDLVTNLGERPRSPGEAQHNLRTFSLIAVLCASQCSPLAVKMYSARLRQAAAAKIVAAGGRVGYDSNVENDFARRPAWLRIVLGKDFYVPVDSVDLHSRSNPDSPPYDLLHHFPDIRSLRVFPTGEITELNMEQISRLKKLEFLSLEAKRTSRAALGRLKAIPSLKALRVDIDGLGDAELQELATLSQLTSLLITSKGNITDVGVAPLKNLTRLEYLVLGGTQITDAGVAHLAHLTRLKGLALPDATRVTDAAMPSLKGLGNLETLNVSWTQITNAGLQNLRGLPKLHHVNVQGTKATEKMARSICGPSPEDLESEHWQMHHKKREDGTKKQKNGEGGRH